MQPFFSALAPDLRTALLAQLRDLWTHTSTALEGNTLTLGETAFVLAYGLTVEGRPLAHHQDVVGHARAIDLLYGLLDAPQLLEADLFALHRAVQSEQLADIMQPIGAWKREPNGTHAMTAAGGQTFIDYAPPADVPALMAEWLELANAPASDPLAAYVGLHVSFVRIHPFIDGNGRMARLLANLPVLRAGQPPIVIEARKRRQYIGLLAEYELAVGPIRSGQPLLPEAERLTGFQDFCRDNWQASLDLVAEAERQQAGRL
jgi:Fic family protein